MKQKNSQQPEISPIKKILFGVIFFFVIILALEFFLGFAGLEKYDKEFMPKSSYPIFVPGTGEMSDYYVTKSHFENYINFQTFLKRKPVGVTRIFIVGGSAAFAWPYTEEYGFSGYLRRALDRAASGKFEIINAAGMSYGSHRVLDVLKDVVQFEPDLVIIYSGNNEYVERNVIPEIKRQPGPLDRIAKVLDHTEIYRAVRLALFRISPKTFQQKLNNDITDLRTTAGPERGSLGRNPEIDQQVLKNYTNNIKAMKEILVAYGIKGIFSTVPVNLSNWIPTVSPPQFVNQQAADRWQELLDLREEAYRRGDISMETDLLRETLQITPNDAGMIFNYGMVLWNLERFNESYRELVRAKDLDARPIRALSVF